ncbi:MAG: hypothetical protein JWP30_1032 [Homoserinimonas sp.]|nr:hypothetical protein [Homoserinimonas sp.]
MAATEATRLPAGWYPDPEGDDQRRWWDGREWTRYTAEYQRPTPIDEPEPTREALAESATDEPDAPARRQRWAQRLGRWLAGAAHRLPTKKRARRRAHRLTR